MSSVNYPLQVGQAGLLAAQNITGIKAGLPIAQNNLLGLRSDGKLYPLPTGGIPNSWLNNSSLQTISALSISAAFDSSYSSQYYQWLDYSNGDPTVAVAGTEYTCVLWMGDGSASSTTNLYIRTLKRGAIVATLQLNSYTTQNYAKLIDLGNGTVMVLYWNSSSSCWAYQILNAATLAVIKAQTTISNASTNADAGVGAALLSNGNVVIAYRKSTPAGYFQVISNTGTSVVAETSLGDASITNTNITVTAGGGYFAIGYSLSSSCNFRRYTNAGALVGTAVALAGSSTSAAGAGQGRKQSRLFMRSDGSLLHLDAISSPYAINVYDTANTLTATVSLGNTNTNLDRVLINDVLYIVRNVSAANMSMVAFGADNQIKLNRTIVTGTSILASATSINSSIWDVSPDGSFCGLFTITDTANFQTNFITYDSSGNQLVNTVIVASGTTNYRVAHCQIAVDSVFLAMGGASGSNLYNMRSGWYYIAYQSIYGVAAASAAKNADVTVQVTGLATISPAMSGGVAFDQRSATIPGIRGVVGGSSAILYGPF